MHSGELFSISPSRGSKAGLTGRELAPSFYSTIATNKSVSIRIFIELLGFLRLSSSSTSGPEAFLRIIYEMLFARFITSVL